jgi:hypothetical protein
MARNGPEFPFVIRVTVFSEVRPKLVIWNDIEPHSRDPCHRLSSPSPLKQW